MEYYVRQEDIDGVSPWLWIKEDSGAWDGPKQNWTEMKREILLHVKTFDAVICAGGNQGMYPRLLSDMFKKVLTFEPDKDNFHCLSHNCNKDNIFKFQAALGKENGMIGLNRQTYTNTGCHTIMDGNEIPILKIDNFALEALNYIQLDVEGYEPNVLEGARESIAKFKPVISCENGLRSEIVNFLDQFSYSKVGYGGMDTFYAVI